MIFIKIREQIIPSYKELKSSEQKLKEKPMLNAVLAKSEHSQDNKSEN
jgi:hypothetical protein